MSSLVACQGRPRILTTLSLVSLSLPEVDMSDAVAGRGKQEDEIKRRAELNVTLTHQLDGLRPALCPAPVHSSLSPFPVLSSGSLKCRRSEPNFGPKVPLSAQTACIFIFFKLTTHSSSFRLTSPSMSTRQTSRCEFTFRQQKKTLPTSSLPFLCSSLPLDTR